MAKEQVLTVDKDVSLKGDNQRIILEIPKEKPRHHLQQHIGSNVTNIDLKIGFVSSKKEAMFFVDDNNIIKFKNNLYETDNPNEIEFLRSHPVFEREIWEKEFPEWMVKKIQESRKYLTRDPKEHEA